MATRIAAAELTCVDEYYANKKRRAHMRESFLTNIANESLSFDPAELSESEVEETKANIFDELSHSNETLRLLTRDILSCWSKYNTEQEWKDIADFPELVSRWWCWFKGQRYILFRYINGPSLSEIKETLGKFVSEEHQQLRVEESSPNLLIRETIAKQKRFLDSHSVDSKPGLSTRQDLWHCSFGQGLQIFCSGCREQIHEDLMPKWATRRPGRNIAYRKKCFSAQCRVNGKSSETRKCMVPVDTSTTMGTK